MSESKQNLCEWCSGFPERAACVPGEGTLYSCSHCGLRVCGYCLDTHDCKHGGPIAETARTAIAKAKPDA